MRRVLFTPGYFFPSTIPFRMNINIKITLFTSPATTADYYCYIHAVHYMNFSHHIKKCK